jgi:hypothetical protein
MRARDSAAVILSEAKDLSVYNWKDPSLAMLAQDDNGRGSPSPSGMS